MLRLAIAELDEGERPREVAIDEAVALAKRYATPTRRGSSTASWANRPRDEEAAGMSEAESHCSTPRSCSSGSRRRAARLEATEDPEAAIEILAELSEIAKQVEAELTRAKQAADADA